MGQLAAVDASSFDPPGPPVGLLFYFRSKHLYQVSSIHLVSFPFSGIFLFFSLSLDNGFYQSTYGQLIVNFESPCAIGLVLPRMHCLHNEIRFISAKVASFQR